MLVSARTLGNHIWIAGMLLIAASIAWWFVVFSDVLGRGGAAVVGLSPGLGQWVGCLSSSAGPCAVIAGLARLGGRIAYEPLLLWAGIVTLWAGAGLRIAAELRVLPNLQVGSRRNAA